MTGVGCPNLPVNLSLVADSRLPWQRRLCWVGAAQQALPGRRLKTGIVPYWERGGLVPSGEQESESAVIWRRAK